MKCKIPLFVVLALYVSTPAALAWDSKVFEAQRILANIGHDPGPIDGLWGRKTERALKAFLRDENVLWDGKFDGNELELLKKSMPIPPPRPSSTEVAENNFCKALNNGGSARYRIPLSRIANDFDTTGILPDLKYGVGWGDHFQFVNLFNSRRMYLIAGANDRSYEPPNEDLPLFVYRPQADPENAFGNGSEHNIEILTKLVTGIHQADVNVDGYEDLIIVDYGEHDHEHLAGGAITVFEQLPDSRKFKMRVVHSPRQRHHRSVVVDIDNDGDVDIVTAGGFVHPDKTRKRGHVTVFANDGRGVFTEDKEQFSHLAEVWFVDAQDLNSDGYPDLILGRNDGVWHYVYFDRNKSGRKAEITFNDKSKRFKNLEILYMTVRKEGNASIAYFFTTRDYYDHYVFKNTFFEERQISSELIWSKNKDSPEFGGRGINFVYGCSDGIYTFRMKPTYTYANQKNGFYRIADY